VARSTSPDSTFPKRYDPDLGTYWARMNCINNQCVSRSCDYVTPAALTGGSLVAWASPDALAAWHAIGPALAPPGALPLV
jgi:hypothetical protein